MMISTTSAVAPTSRPHEHSRKLLPNGWKRLIASHLPTAYLRAMILSNTPIFYLNAICRCRSSMAAVLVA
ncbi:hypothetical protein [Azospirillum endophyticum]